MRKFILFMGLILSLLPTSHAQKVGLVLSGGGAKGMTHIGIIRALEENNIPIDYIAGTSMGAIIGIQTLVYRQHRVPIPIFLQEEPPYAGASELAFLHSRLPTRQT